MPYHVEESPTSCGESTPWAVIKDDDGTVMGCHASESEAQSQLSALNAQEEPAPASE